MRRPTNKEINILAKEACWESGGSDECKGNCAKCYGKNWKKWKYVVKAIINGFVRIENDRVD